MKQYQQYQEVIINSHIHTIYSDGLFTHKKIAEIASECGLDAVIFNDHNIHPKGFDRYYHFGQRKVLSIVGEEIHNINRQPQKNHLLIIGTKDSFCEFAEDPMNLIQAISQSNGLSFIAHAYDPALPEFGEENLSWEDWSVTGYSGLELWNNLSEFKIRVKNKLQGFFYAFFPKFLALQPPEEIKKIWGERLNLGIKTVAMGGSDAHTITYRIGIFKKDVFHYKYHFQAINNHVLIAQPLTGIAEQDIETIITSIREGRLFIANDLVYPSKGFRFFIKQGKQTIEMGANCHNKRNTKLEVYLPARANCVLIRNGKVYKKYKNILEISESINQPGNYRLECYRNYLFKQRGWIFSNPIYVQ